MTAVIALRLTGDKAPVAFRYPSKKAATLAANDLHVFATVDEFADPDRRVTTRDMVALYNSLADKPVQKFTDRATAAQRTWAIIEEKVTMNDINQADTSKGVPEGVSEKMKAATEAQNKAKAEKAAAAAEKKAAAEKAAAERKAAAEAKKAEAAEKKAAAAKAKADAKAQRDAERAAKKAEKGASAGNGRRSALSGHKLTAVVKEGENGSLVNPRREGSHGHRSLQIIIDNPGITTEDYVKAGGRMNDLHWDVDHGNVKTEAPAEEKKAA